MPDLADLEWVVEDIRRRLPTYELVRDYDEGRHRLLFATEKFRNAFGDLFREFANNLCDDVVDGLTDRLQIVGWTSPDAAIQEAVTKLWEENQGAARVGAVHRTSVRDGDGFTIVEMGKDGRAHAYKQNPATMALRYSDEAPGEKELAGKVWRQGKRYRANLYYADGRIEKYATKGTGANGGLPKAGAFSLLEAGDPALRGGESVAYTDDRRMPVYHYPNGELSEYGRSVLIGVIPLQDGLNKACADMLVTMEGTAAPVRHATGIQATVDPETGREADPFKGTTQKPGTVLWTGSKDARFGQFDAADLSGFLDVQDQFKIDIVRKGLLPPHSITLRGSSAAYPSGASLLVAEGRTIKWARDRQRDWGTEHRAEMAHELSLTLMREVTPDMLEIEWAPPETRDEQALLETLLMKRELGVSQGQTLKEAGYSPDQVAEFLEANDDEARNAQATQSVLQGGRGAVSTNEALALERSLGLPMPDEV